MLENTDYFNQVMIILGGSVVSTALLRRLRLPPVLGYLMVGLLIGPYALHVPVKRDPGLEFRPSLKMGTFYLHLGENKII